MILLRHRAWPPLGANAGMTPPAEVLDQRYPARRILDLIGSRWTPVVLYCLSQEVGRFNEMQRRIPDISKKMLTHTLRDLERKGLVERTAFPVVPLKTEYRLTPLGLKLREPISWLCEWAINNEAFLEELDRV